MNDQTNRKTRAPKRVSTVLDIPLARIDVDLHQPRELFGEAELRELAASIRANGLLQPITVRRVGV
jgi:ParB family transcriptional regulator, chromosome partitioning protein